MASVLFKLLSAMMQQSGGSSGDIVEIDPAKLDFQINLTGSEDWITGKYVNSGGWNNNGQAVWMHETGFMPWLIYTPESVIEGDYYNPGNWRWMIYQSGDPLFFCNDENPTTGTWYMIDYANNTHTAVNAMTVSFVYK